MKYFFLSAGGYTDFFSTYFFVIFWHRPLVDTTFLCSETAVLQRDALLRRSLSACCVWCATLMSVKVRVLTRT